MVEEVAPVTYALPERATCHQVIGALLIIGGLVLVGLEPKI